MATNAFTSSAITLSVSATLPATQDVAGYEALTFTAVGEVTSIGDYGKTYDEITHQVLGDRKTYKFKGFYNEGTTSIALARLEADAGHLILKDFLDGANTDADAAVKVDFGNGIVDYFNAKVMSYVNSGMDGGSIVSASADLAINSDVVTDEGA